MRNWYASTTKIVTVQDKDYSFQISPLEFSIDRGETFQLEIEYIAKTEGSHFQEFIIFFDNIQQTYRIVAESSVPSIDIVEINDEKLDKTGLLLNS
jgi:hypothetical protein